MSLIQLFTPVKSDNIILSFWYRSILHPLLTTKMRDCGEFGSPHSINIQQFQFIMEKNLF